MNIRRMVKISMISLATMVILVIAGAILLVNLINPNTFKPMIANAVHDSTGRNLAINGNISWKLWPNIGFQIEKLSLSNPDGHTATNMIEVSTATLTVQLMPLLDRNIIIDSIIIDGLNIGLIKKNGLNNWTFKPLSGLPTSTNEATANKSMQLRLNKFSLIHSTFSYVDMDINKRYNIKDFSLKLETEYGGEISLNQDKQKISLDKIRFDFDNIMNGRLNFVLDNFDKPIYKGDLDIDKFSLTRLINKLNLPFKAMNSKDLFDKVAISTVFNGDLNSIVLSKFNFNLSDAVKGLLNIKVNDFSNPSYAGDIKVGEFSANLVLNKMNVAVAGKINKPLLDKVAFNTKFDGNTNKVDLQQLNFIFPGTLQGLVNVKIQNFSSPSYAGNIDLPIFSLNQLMLKLAMEPLNIPNKKLLDKVSLKTNFYATGNSFNLGNLVSKVSDLDVNGDIKIPSFEPLNLTENIRISKFDIADIIDANGFKVPLTGITLSGNLSNSRSDFNNMSGVSASQNITVDKVTVLGIDLNSLFRQFDNAIGTTGKSVNLANLASIQHSALAIQAVQNMRTIAANAGTKGPKNYNNKTDFGMLRSNIIMHNGMVNPSSFKLNGPTLKGDGKGSANMINKSLNYNVAIQISAPQKNQVLNKIIFPFHTQGKFSNLESSVDWASIQVQLIKYLITQTVKDKTVATDQVDKQIDNLTKGANRQVKQDVDAIKQGAVNLINNIFK
ncbi:MAG: hypothetical protein K0R94_516 [Burkholderiales bacterium]|jgi:AsmA protein|nr:hypothetical protein [Burkholderiales bacterium]